ncbi:HD-GYP domain-containing protein [Massilia sp. BJB1822]|uniref:HD-GYP domain-containing protein n=1 Tax=Massilia sp. BJB1822 TaxID=2744470 RepID=UPI001594B25A|nr:HD-GYP domain-containing protein [Massilia sp. BJB1822]NVD97798.1 HD-GYP domain-containing protein [Massilia sp. BJB1822]
MLKKIPVEKVRQGMYLQQLCGSWLNSPFWQTSFAIDGPELVHQVRNCGVREIWIDVARGVDVMEQPAGSAALGQPASAADTPRFSFGDIASVTVAEELERAARLVNRSKEAVGAMFNEARMGRLSNVSSAMPLVEEIAASVLRNPGALVSLVRLKQADDYTYLHSVAVCALMVALARKLGLDDEEVRECGMAGLLHDIGKMAVPNDILNKPGKLTDAEFGTVKGHPSAGHRLLIESESVSPIALDVCLHHHEKYDGSGYPHGLKGEEISLHARMGAVCDVYDAITSDRPYKAGWCPAESLRKMAEWTKAGHFDPVIFAAFVKCIGIYPVGTLVRLKSGRLGVVLDNTKSLLQPQVRVFFSTKSTSYIPPETIDLALPGLQESITAREDAAAWNFPDVDRYWLTAA